MEVIPSIDLLGGKVVRLRRGSYQEVTVYDRTPRELVASFASQGARRVHIVDLDGARDGRPVQADLVREILSEHKLRVQVGGGIRTMAQVEAYLAAGAFRVVIGTAAVKDPDFVREACHSYRVIVAVDARDGMVAVEGWREGSTVRAADLAREAEMMGAVGVLYTDIARDGVGSGPNVEETAALGHVVGVEVIASGGVGTLEHVRALAQRREISAVVVGRALYEGNFTVAEAIAAAR